MLSRLQSVVTVLIRLAKVTKRINNLLLGSAVYEWREQIDNKIAE